MATRRSSTSTWMWPSVGVMLRVVRLTIFALVRCTSSSAPLAGTVAPLRGETIVSLAGLLGRGPSVSDVGVAPALLSPEQPARAAISARAAARATARFLWLNIAWVVPPRLLVDDLLEAGACAGSSTGLGVDRERPAAGGQVGVGREVADAEAQDLQGHRVTEGGRAVASILPTSCSLPSAAKKVKWTWLRPALPGSAYDCKVPPAARLMV